MQGGAAAGGGAFSAVEGVIELGEGVSVFARVPLFMAMRVMAGNHKILLQSYSYLCTNCKALTAAVREVRKSFISWHVAG